jgi:hypothetical protein
LNNKDRKTKRSLEMNNVALIASAIKKSMTDVNNYDNIIATFGNFCIDLWKEIPSANITEEIWVGNGVEDSLLLSTGDLRAEFSEIVYEVHIKTSAGHPIIFVKEYHEELIPA